MSLAAMRGYDSSRFWRLKLILGLLCLGCGIQVEGGAATSDPARGIHTDPTPPVSAREFYNLGTAKLAEGKLREAEILFEDALAAQQEKLQAPSLYNLGHARFSQGVAELKKGPSSRGTATRGNVVGQRADLAIRSADQALAGDDVQAMVASYLRGRGVRQEVKAAAAAVRRALESSGAALNKWQRSSGDFHGSADLNRGDTDASYNAAVVDRSIAKLVDSMNQLQQMANSLAEKNQNLGDKLKLLKGKIPAPNMPPGAEGDEEEDEKQPTGSKPDQKEGPSKEGQEISLSPEQAGWLLEGFRLDNERRLPMGQGQPGQPKDRRGRDW